MLHYCQRLASGLYETNTYSIGFGIFLFIFLCLMHLSRIIFLLVLRFAIFVLHFLILFLFVIVLSMYTNTPPSREIKQVIPLEVDTNTRIINNPSMPWNEV